MSFLVKVYAKLRAIFFALMGNKVKDAAQAWHESGGEAVHAFWLYAAPVNLLLGRDSFFLSEPAPLSMAHEEAAALIEALNQHFAEKGYHFYLQDDAWFLGLDVDPKIMTTPVHQVVNKDVASYLPEGEGALAWAALQNEIQMLLFSHPVNQVRETKKMPLINSLWCYGLSSSG